MNRDDIPRTDFGVETETFFKNLPFNEKKEALHFHQYIINKFMIEKKRRGLLIFHSMGFGKTMLAVSITEAYRKLDPTRKAIILLPRSLQANFTDTLRSYIQKNEDTTSNSSGEDANVIEKHYKFVSLNSSNMYSQIGKLEKTKEEVEFEKNLGLLTDKIGDGSLENSVLVIDEFHNLSNAITNGSKNGLNLYNKIMSTKNIKLIFLTGTPIINNPFELVCVMNMLKGKKLFPENIRDFLSFYVDYNKYTIKNKSKFQNRIVGLVSYYGDEYFDGIKPGFPQELPMKIEHVPMSKEQFARYLEMREIENKEEARKFARPHGDNSQFNQKGSASSSYRIRSRQVSNFLIPPDALTYQGTKIVAKDIAKISSNTYKNLEVYSPKNLRILENIKKHPKQLQLVFSQFTTLEGLGLFAKVLEANGYEEWKPAAEDTIALKKKKPLGKAKGVKKKEETEVRQLNMDDADDYSVVGGRYGQISEVLSESSDSSDSMQELIIGGKYMTKYIRVKRSPKSGGNKKPTYAIYSGDVLPSIRNRLIEIFNSKENMHGEIIQILLISNQTGGLGLDLHGVRAIHIMEPFWNWALILQIIARGVRYNSHKDFPSNEQNVQPYMYLSVFPESYKAVSDDEDSKVTTDMHLYTEARNNRKLNETFLLSLIEASVDCSIHQKKLSTSVQSKIDCHVCAPTGELLYDADFYKDMAPDAYNPCKKYTPKKIETKELLFTPPNGADVIKFYYNNSDPKNIKIYEYNSRLEGYTPLKPSHQYYSDIMRMILNI